LNWTPPPPSTEQLELQKLEKQIAIKKEKDKKFTSLRFNQVHTKRIHTDKSHGRKVYVANDDVDGQDSKLKISLKTKNLKIYTEKGVLFRG
jgi:hypothetical protein